MDKHQLIDFKAEDTVEITDSVDYQGEKKQFVVTWKVKGPEKNGGGVFVERLEGSLEGRTAVLPGSTKVSPIGRTAQRLQREAERNERMVKMQQIVNSGSAKTTQSPKGKTPRRSGGVLAPNKLYVPEASLKIGVPAHIIRTAIKNGELAAENVNPDGLRPTYILDSEPLEKWNNQRNQSPKESSSVKSRVPKGSKHPKTSWENPFGVGSRMAGFYHTFKTLRGRATFDQLLEGCLKYRLQYGIEDNEDLIRKDLASHRSGWLRGKLGLVVEQKESKGTTIYVLKGFAPDAPKKAHNI